MNPWMLPLLVTGLLLLQAVRQRTARSSTSGLADRLTFDAAVKHLEPIFVVTLGNQVERLVLEVLGIVDGHDLLGIDEAEALRRVAEWKATRVTAGTWDDNAAAAASATLCRHRTLNGLARE